MGGRENIAYICADIKIFMTGIICTCIAVITGIAFMDRTASTTAGIDTGAVQPIITTGVRIICILTLIANTGVIRAGIVIIAVIIRGAV